MEVNLPRLIPRHSFRLGLAQCLSFSLVISFLKACLGLTAAAPRACELRWIFSYSSSSARESKTAWAIDDNQQDKATLRLEIHSSFRNSLSNGSMQSCLSWYMLSWSSAVHSEFCEVGSCLHFLQQLQRRQTDLLKSQRGYDYEHELYYAATIQQRNNVAIAVVSWIMIHGFWLSCLTTKYKIQINLTFSFYQLSRRALADSLYTWLLHYIALILALTCHCSKLYALTLRNGATQKLLTQLSAQR